MENTPVDSMMATTDEDEAAVFHTSTNGHLTEHTLDSGHYGSHAVTDDLETSSTKL